MKRIWLEEEGMLAFEWIFILFTLVIGIVRRKSKYTEKAVPSSMVSANRSVPKVTSNSANKKTTLIHLHSHAAEPAALCVVEYFFHTKSTLFK